VGAYPSIVVFDFARIADHATFRNPHQLSEGIIHLLLNGRWVLRDGQFTSTHASKVVKRGSKGGPYSVGTAISSGFHTSSARRRYSSQRSSSSARPK